MAESLARTLSAMSSTTERLESLQNVRLFSECTHDELVLLERLADEIEVEAGTRFVTQGHYSRDAYIVVEGTARVERDGQPIGKAGPGDTIGELSVIEPGLRTATVTAETPMTVLAMQSPQFLTAIEDVPPLAWKILRSMAKRLREALEDDPLV
jgi:CRP/FNR family transcriptional regulator, cyclic AMP receptor protein